MLKPGSAAPDFTLTAQDGRSFRLSEALAEGPVVLYFYPKDETPVCTAEACSFRDQYDVFTEAGAKVIGVSRDSVASHKRFAAHHHLPFTLLSDEDGRVRDQFDVKKTLGLFDGRVTFVIDRESVVRYAFSSALNAKAHVEHALEAIRRVPPA
jgi:thioredoxin-dependent peroxiredoxin